jgi:hypothetical protein
MLFEKWTMPQPSGKSLSEMILEELKRDKYEKVHPNKQENVKAMDPKVVQVYSK